ncbi:MAG TPA: sodium/proton-translocating pyrophosphatase [Polyangiaceae bacterium]|nr:sodium/proton-translocating pyrophosphatase [Polyangiaceae bacterium]
MLTEIAVVLSLAFVGVLLAGLLSRWTLVRAQGTTEARRVVSAATRAAEAFLFREGKYAGVGLVVAVLILLATHGVFVLRRTHGFGMTLALWSALGMLVGAALTLAGAYLATEIGLRATLGAIRATVVGLSGATALAARASGVAALAADALTTGAIAGFLGLMYLLGGGASAGPVQAALLLDRALVALPGLALGSVLTAVVVGLSSSAYHVSTAVGALGAEGLDANDPKNPSLVASLVGEHVGLGVRRTVDATATLFLAHVATLALTAVPFRLHGATLGGHAWALVTLPLVIRGIGIVASAFGLMTTRTTETGAAHHAILRGQITAGVLVLGGVGGASLWLLSGRAVGFLFGAGAAGVAASLVIGQSPRLQVDRRFGPLQELLEATRVGRGATAAKGLALGFRGAFIPVVALAAALVAAFQLGKRSPLEGGAELAMATALASLLATSAFLLGAGLLGPVASSALTVAQLEPDGLRPETRRRAVLLEDGGFSAGASSDSYFAAVGATATILAGLAIGSRGAPSPLPGFQLDALGIGALGAALVLAFSGRAVDFAAKAARGTWLEVERQLRGFPREAGVPVLPASFTPSYRVVIELAGKLSVEGVVLLSALSLVVPVGVVLALRAAYGAGSASSTEDLASFVVLAGAAALFAGLFTDAAHAALRAAYRESRPRGAGTGFDAAIAGQELGNFLGGSFSPAARSFAKAVAAAALVAVPFLTAV